MYRMLVGSLGNSSNASASDGPGDRACPSSSYSLCELFLASALLLSIYLLLSSYHLPCCIVFLEFHSCRSHV